MTVENAGGKGGRVGWVGQRSGSTYGFHLSRTKRTVVITLIVPKKGKGGGKKKTSIKNNLHRKTGNGGGSSGWQANVSGLDVLRK